MTREIIVRIKDYSLDRVFSLRHTRVISCLYYAYTKIHESFFVYCLQLEYFTIILSQLTSLGHYIVDYDIIKSTLRAFNR